MRPFVSATATFLDPSRCRFEVCSTDSPGSDADIIENGRITAAVASIGALVSFLHFDLVSELTSAFVSLFVRYRQLPGYKAALSGLGSFADALQSTERARRVLLWRKQSEAWQLAHQQEFQHCDDDIRHSESFRTFSAFAIGAARSTPAQQAFGARPLAQCRRFGSHGCSGLWESRATRQRRPGRL